VGVIDPHRRGGTHIEGAALSYEDPFASSASELVVELMQYLVEPGDLLRQEAEAVLAGIVLDTKNFSLRTGGRTFEAAAYLRRVGADTGEVRKLFQSDLSGTRARNEITHSAEMLPHNIAFAVAADLTDRVVAAKAADDLLAIRGVEASFVLFPFGEKRVGLSGRSTGNVNVQLICEALGGGGNAAAAAAQWKDVTLAEAQDRFRAAVAAYFKNA
jgi:c-di-AMP phosphodiesterase-like protein